MARLIRRHSMERLELYDLDTFIPVPCVDRQLPPPLPPARAHWRRPSANATLERYQFLCNTTRTKTDPIYAATPMFTTIPPSPGTGLVSRQLLGSHVRADNIHPIAVKSADRKVAPAKIDQLAEVEVDDNDEEEEESELLPPPPPSERNIAKGTGDNSEPPNSDGSSESSSTGSDEQDEDPLLDDDDKDVIEQIFNRDTKK